MKTYKKHNLDQSLDAFAAILDDQKLPYSQELIQDALIDCIAKDNKGYRALVAFADRFDLNEEICEQLGEMSNNRNLEKSHRARALIALAAVNSSCESSKDINALLSKARKLHSNSFRTMTKLDKLTLPEHSKKARAASGSMLRSQTTSDAISPLDFLDVNTRPHREMEPAKERSIQYNDQGVAGHWVATICDGGYDFEPLPDEDNY